MEKRLTLEEAVEYLKSANLELTYESLRRKISVGVIDGARVGRRIYTTKSALDRYVNFGGELANRGGRNAS